MTFDVLKLLEQEGYIKDGEDNLVHAEKAFFAARVMRWIRNKVQTEPDFNLKQAGYVNTGGMKQMTSLPGND